MTIKAEKKALVDEITTKLSKTKSAVIINYRGLTVAQDNKLRRKFRDVNIEYHVIKNTMASFAANKIGITDLDKYLKGPSAIAISYDNHIDPAKVICDFAKEFKVIEIKAGILEGKVINETVVKILADLPPREILIAKLLGTLCLPITKFIKVLNGNIFNLVYVLDAVRKQKESHNSTM